MYATITKTARVFKVSYKPICTFVLNISNKNAVLSLRTLCDVIMFTTVISRDISSQ